MGVSASVLVAGTLSLVALELTKVRTRNGSLVAFGHLAFLQNTTLPIQIPGFHRQDIFHATWYLVQYGTV